MVQLTCSANPKIFGSLCIARLDFATVYIRMSTLQVFFLPRSNVFAECKGWVLVVQVIQIAVQMTVQV